MIKYYIFVDRRRKSIIHEFKANGDFEDFSVAFLSAYCARSATKPQDIVILTSEVDPALRKDIDSRVERALAANNDALDRRVTGREGQVVALLKTRPGVTNKEISNELGISERTVKFHVSSLLEKFNVQGRSELTHVLNTLLT